MQYREFFSAVKIENIIRKILMVVTFLLKTLIVGTRYPRVPTIYVLDQKIRKIGIVQFYFIKVMYKGAGIHFPDMLC